jgi:hypothetical protein
LSNQQCLTIKGHSVIIKIHAFDIFVQVLLLDRRAFEILEVGLFVEIGLGHFVGGFEDVDGVEGGRDHHFKVDGMEADLLDFLLALVQEHQLIGDLGVSFFVLHRHVPDRQPVVLAGHGNDGLLVGLEFD